MAPRALKKQKEEAKAQRLGKSSSPAAQPLPDNPPSSASPMPTASATEGDQALTHAGKVSAALDEGNAKIVTLTHTTPSHITTQMTCIAKKSDASMGPSKLVVKAAQISKSSQPISKTGKLTLTIAKPLLVQAEQLGIANETGEQQLIHKAVTVVRFLLEQVSQEEENDDLEVGEDEGGNEGHKSEEDQVDAGTYDAEWLYHEEPWKFDECG
jgi:hypothetical protein